MTKYNLSTFKTYTKTFKGKIQNKVIQLKEEKTLLTRFLITARKRQEIDLPHFIGNFEFTVVPKSLFSPDGEYLLSKDKASILHAISDDVQQNIGEIISEETPSTLIIDGMAVVNQITKTSEIKTCQVSKTTYSYSCILNKQWGLK